VNEISSVSIDSADDVVVAHVSGEIDLSNARTLGDELAASVPNRALGLVIDLTATAYLDSSGVSLVFDLSERLRRRQQDLRLVVPDNAPLRRVLGIVDAGEVVPILTTVDEAVTQIRGA
jgi:anti-sigma B factor antagonist